MSRQEERDAASAVIRAAQQLNTIIGAEEGQLERGDLTTIEIRKRRDDDLLNAMVAYRDVCLADAEREITRLRAEGEQWKKTAEGLKATLEAVCGIALELGMVQQLQAALSTSGTAEEETTT